MRFSRPAVAVVAATCLLSLAACGSSPASNPATGGTTAPVQAGGTDGATPSGSAPVGSSNDGGAPTPTYPTTAEDYAKAAIAAYAANDIARLDQLEVSDGTLHTLLGCGGCYDVHFTLVGPCGGAMGSSYCLFFNTVGDSLRLRLSNPALGQARAIGTGSIWDPISFPAATKAYAQEALDAWQSGNDARLKLLTSKPFTSAQISALGADQHGQWTYGGADGAAGSTYERFMDSAGHKLAFRFTNGAGTPPTTGPASQHRITDIVYLTS